MADTHDTQDIQQELDTIVGEAKDVLARMDMVKHRFDAVAVQVDAVEKEFVEAKATIEHHLGDTATRAKTVIQHLNAARDGIQSRALQPYIEAITNMTSHLEGQAAQFDASVQSVLAAIDGSHGVAEQLGSLVSQSDHDHHDGARQSIQTMQDDLAHFAQQFDGHTQPAMNTLHDELEHLQQQSESTSQETHDHMQEIMHAADDHLHQGLLDPVAAHVNENADRLNQIASADFDAQFHALLDKGREGIENRFKSEFSAVMDKIAHDLDEVEQQIHQAGEHSAIPREAMKPLIDGIEGAFKELHPVVNTVKDIASAVGVDL